jgi:methylated-DNA-[protein]-cysteine S-methyltransferase
VNEAENEIAAWVARSSCAWPWRARKSYRRFIECAKSAWKTEIYVMKPEKQYQYDLFKTPWGWFGVLGTGDGLLRIQLPDTDKEAVKSMLLKGLEGAKHNKTAFSVLKTKIIDYYQGKPVDFRDIKVKIDAFTPFQQTVLCTLRRVKAGKTITYRQLADKSGRGRAARAIGSVMAANPLPLVIPCHRVIKSDGSLGHFSGPGGPQTKKRMLDLEQSQNP